MRTITQSVYNIEELKELCPKAFKKAFDKYVESVYEYGIHWQDEIYDSLKAIKNASGYNTNKERDCDNLTGKRAFAWIENNLLYQFRIPFGLHKDYKSYMRYGEGYRANKVKPCPFTGCCADEDFLGVLKDCIKDGLTLKEAFRSLDDEATSQIEQEQEHQTSEEYFIEHAEANNYEFTDKGELI